MPSRTEIQSHAPVPDPRLRILPLLRRHGWNATSFQVVEPEFRYWFDDAGDAAVAYVDTGRAWVVAGAPVSDIETAAEVIARFLAAAKAAQRRVAFFAVEPRLLRAARMPALRIGQQPSWNPSRWTERHRGHRSLREQLRRAHAKGVGTRRVESRVAAGPMRPELEALIHSWVAARVMPPMSFLVALEPFQFAEERRYYVARHRGEAVGLLVAVPVFGRNGWFFEDILRTPDAPNGTTELLIDAAMRDVAASGSTFVTLGLAPLAVSQPWARIARRLTSGFYNFEGVRAFKAKLRPERWTPIYLAWPPGRTAVGALYDVLDAFAGGHLVSFAARSLFRAPAPVLRLLGVLLAAWTIALLAADTRRWFPSRRNQLAWGLFDGAMIATLFALSREWRRPLATAAAVAAAADGVLTTVQASRYNARRARGLGDTIIIGAAVLAPFVASAVLFGRLRATSPPRSSQPSPRATGPRRPDAA